MWKFTGGTRMPEKKESISKGEKRQGEPMKKSSLDVKTLLRNYIGLAFKR